LGHCATAMRSGASSTRTSSPGGARHPAWPR
jgi:hypothetical protein